ncbi:MAG: hypothetical protein LBD68_02175 [Zoogloeaceae bacterium]|jgi:hypothetical protein|nr:hypothetical protein [Zoogloeaceae bacterium]
MNTFVITSGCLTASGANEAPFGREVGSLQTSICRRFCRCKPLLAIPCQQIFALRQILLLHMAFLRLPCFRARLQPGKTALDPGASRAMLRFGNFHFPGISDFGRQCKHALDEMGR